MITTINKKNEIRKTYEKKCTKNERINEAMGSPTKTIDKIDWFTEYSDLFLLFEITLSPSNSDTFIF